MNKNSKKDLLDSLQRTMIWSGIGYASGSRGFTELAKWVLLGSIGEEVFGFKIKDLLSEFGEELKNQQEQQDESSMEKINVTPDLEIPTLRQLGQPAQVVTTQQILRYDKWHDVIKHPAIVVILGGRGEGKSAAGYQIAEEFRYSLTPYIVGFPENKKNLLPGWMGIAQRLEDVPPGSIIIVDEAYLPYHSRAWQKSESKEICQLLNRSRQQNKTIIFIAQQGRQIDIDIVSSADVLVVKNPGMLQPKFDRPEFRDLLKEAQQALQSIEGDIRRWSYVSSKNASQPRLMENDLPTFWTSKLGEAYADLGNLASSEMPKPMPEDEKRQKAKELYQAKWSQDKIATHFDVSKSTVFNWIHDYPYRVSPKENSH